MAIKAIVSFNQKLGQPNYGSVGVGCSVEVELDSSLLDKDLSLLKTSSGEKTFGRKCVKKPYYKE